MLRPWSAAASVAASAAATSSRRAASSSPRVKVSSKVGGNAGADSPTRAQGKKVIVSGLAVSFGFAHPLARGRQVNFRPWYTDMGEQYRFKTTLLVDMADATRQDSFMLRFGPCIRFVSFSGPPLVFEGLAASNALRVVSSQESGMLFCSKLQATLENGTVVTVIDFGCPSIGDRAYAAGIVAPSGTAKLRIRPALVFKDFYTCMRWCMLYPLILVCVYLLVMGYRYARVLDEVIGEDTELEADVRELVGGIRHEHSEGNMATASHMQALLDELVAIKQKDKQKVDMARGYRASLESPDSDRYVWLCFFLFVFFLVASECEEGGREGGRG